MRRVGIVLLIILMLCPTSWAELTGTAGELDTSFGQGGKVTTDFSGTADNGLSVALYPEGRLLVAGSTFTLQRRIFALARYLSDGSLDQSFGTNGLVSTVIGRRSAINSVALQADGKIVVAGFADQFFALARYNSDGSLDSGFGAEGIVLTAFKATAAAFSLALDPSGQIILAGTADGDFALARYNNDGSLDDSFGTNGKVLTSFEGHDTAYGVTILPNGRIVASGGTATLEDSNFALAGYTKDGTLDPSFGTEGKIVTDFGGLDMGRAIAPTPGQGLVVAGVSGGAFALARYTRDGQLDESFGSKGQVRTDFGDDATAVAVALQPNGRIVAAGTKGSPVGKDFAIARYHRDGELDAEFGTAGKVVTDFNGGDDTVFSIAISPAGHLVVAGQATVNGATQPDFAVARYNLK